MVILGSFDASGSPVITIRVIGPDGLYKDYQATIDTGFTGFIAMNVNELVPLHLQTEGATEVTLADGSAVYNLLALGSVTVGGKTESGSILLDDNSGDVLVGLDFLRAFNLALIITSAMVILYDKDEALSVIFQLMATEPTGSPDTTPTGGSTGEA